MNYNYDILSASCQKFINAKHELNRIKEILNSMDFPSNYKSLASITGVKGKLEDVITNNSAVINRIAEVASDLELAEQENIKMVDNLKELKTKRKNQKLYNSYNTQIDEIIKLNKNIARRKHTLFDPVLSFEDILHKFQEQCPYQGVVKDDIIPNALVYLPYGYSTDNQYDVAILIKGSGGIESDWFNKSVEGMTGSMLLDNMIYYGEVAPFITIVPTISDSYGGDDLKKYLVDDILPAAATSLSTYIDPNTNDMNQEIKNARNHIGIIGFSWGGTRVERLAGNRWV